MIILIEEPKTFSEAKIFKLTDSVNSTVKESVMLNLEI